MNIPTDRKYSKDHEWAIVGADGIARVGISDFAQDQLGDVVFVELPDAGTQLAQFQKMGEIESVKAVSDLMCPVAGEVVEVNSDVVNKPELLNEDPYEQGWLVKVRVSDLSDVDSLLDAAAYETLTS